jgi:hypothetical protein
MLRMGMRLGIVAMRMGVDVIAVPVDVGVDPRRSPAEQSAAAQPPNGSGEVRESEHDQHDRDGQFHPQPNARRDHPLEDDDAAADEENS